MVAAFVGYVVVPVGGWEVDDLPPWLSSLVDAYVGHAHQRRGLELHVPRPRAVLAHALDVRVPLLVVLDEWLEVVPVGAHVLERERSEVHVLSLVAPPLIAHGAEEAVAVGADLLTTQPEV